MSLTNFPEEASDNGGVIVRAIFCLCISVTVYPLTIAFLIWIIKKNGGGGLTDADRDKPLLHRFALCWEKLAMIP